LIRARSNQQDHSQILRAETMALEATSAKKDSPAGAEAGAGAVSVLVGSVAAGGAVVVGASVAGAEAPSAGGATSFSAFFLKAALSFDFKLSKAWSAVKGGKARKTPTIS